MPEDRLRCEVMKRIASSFFTGKPHDHKYIVSLFGDGDNAKTTLLQLMAEAFPVWVKIIKVDHLLLQKHHRDPCAAEEWKMDVMGCRIIGCEEPKAGAEFDGALIKLLRGGGDVTGRVLNLGTTSRIRPHIAS